MTSPREQAFVSCHAAGKVTLTGAHLGPCLGPHGHWEVQVFLVDMLGILPS